MIAQGGASGREELKGVQLVCCKGRSGVGDGVEGSEKPGKGR